MMGVSVTEKLADFAVETKYSSLPEEVFKQGQRCFLDWLGVTLRGSREPLSSMLYAQVALTGGASQASILGRGYRTNVLNAALVNGAAAHAIDYDDLHWPSLIHPSAAVFAALLAVCEWRGLGGKELLTGYVIGYEVEARIGMACGEKVHKSGRHVTANLSPFGVVAAVANVLGLTPEQTIMAYGIAGTQTAGLIKSFGTMSKPLHTGKAAFNGLQAAMLAQQGYTGASEILEGQGGVLPTIAGDIKLDDMLTGLGNSFEVMNNSFKAYASCFGTHASIDAALSIRRQFGPDPHEVDKIICRAPALQCTAAGKPAPETGLEGKFSIQYCVSVALTEGGATEDKFVDEKVRNPLLKELTRKVVLESDPVFSNTEAMIKVKMKNGLEYEAKIDCCIGTPVNPMEEADLEKKFRSLTAAILTPKNYEKLSDLLGNLAELRNIKSIVELCG